MGVVVPRGGCGWGILWRRQDPCDTVLLWVSDNMARGDPTPSSLAVGIIENRLEKRADSLRKKTVLTGEHERTHTQSGHAWKDPRETEAAGGPSSSAGVNVEPKRMVIFL